MQDDVFRWNEWNLENATKHFCTVEELEWWADILAGNLAAHIAREVENVAVKLKGPIRTLLTAGSGEFLVPRVLALVNFSAPIVSLAERWGTAGSTAAAAFAVAMLCLERGG